ncbi:MAG TPA: hypothetical protein PK400_06045 [Phycisphaerales bacterium]|nr:hypothetical protein [Phycisphaerales bacterium]HRQ76446.1 hypothetical protein [Phycisphaerales bacterium]
MNHVSKHYLRGISNPKQRAFLQALVQVKIKGTNAPIADACAAAGIWRGTPARWFQSDRRFTTAYEKACEVVRAHHVKVSQERQLAYERERAEASALFLARIMRAFRR